MSGFNEQKSIFLKLWRTEFWTLGFVKTALLLSPTSHPALQDAGSTGLWQPCLSPFPSSSHMDLHPLCSLVQGSLWEVYTSDPGCVSLLKIINYLHLSPCKLIPTLFPHKVGFTGFRIPHGCLLGDELNSILVKPLSSEDFRIGPYLEVGSLQTLLFKMRSYCIRESPNPFTGLLLERKGDKETWGNHHGMTEGETGVGFLPANKR